MGVGFNVVIHLVLMKFGQFWIVNHMKWTYRQKKSRMTIIILDAGRDTIE